MTRPARPSRPWILAGGVAFAVLEVGSIGYAILAGRLTLSQRTFVSATVLTVLMALFGLFVGFIFAKVRRVFGSLNTYAQGVVALVVMSAVAGVITKGPTWFVSSADFGVSSIMSAAAGLLFAHAGLRFGADRLQQVEGSDE